MALIVKDRVQETTTTTGTGTLTLAGAVTGFQTFSTAIGNSNTTYYAISSSGSEFEVGIGTVGAGTLARTTILASSNSGSVVNLSAGTKNVFCTQPAGKSLYLDANGNTISLGVLTSPKIETSILDINGNELTLLTATASAVNEFTIANAATANAPEISATGSDTNIDLKITPKGSGKINLDGIKFPNADGSSGQFLKTDGSGSLSFADSGLAWQSVVTTSTITVVAGRAYFINTTSNACTVTLPSGTPTAGQQVQLVDYAGTFDTNACIINPNGNKIEGATSNLQLTGEREGVILTYIDSTQGWLATSGINEGTDALEPVPILADFLVIAGGGGGGGNDVGGWAGAGGGAGGFRTFTSQTLMPATNYTVTVGAGGAGGGLTTFGTQGGTSTFNTTSSSGGGGGGRSTGNGAGVSGLTGGSGGGGAGNIGVTNGGAGNQGGYSPSEGNNGGGNSGNSNNPGGGGGAGAVGNAGTAGGAPTAGGAGTANSITGSSVTYSTGGGSQQTSGSAGGANTGNGGDAQTGASSVGLSGGSGVVIIKYPDTLTISNPGGGLTSTTATAGGFSVTTFTAGTGNIQLN